MKELITKTQAIVAVLSVIPNDGYWNLEVEAAINRLTPVQPTLYGYNIEHLALIATVLQKENLPPERVREAITDISRIVAIVKAEYEEALRKAVEHGHI